jgi:hypothetical protein
VLDVVTGRWLEEDPEGFDAGDADLYRYVGNNPTNATDPSGNALFALGKQYAEVDLIEWLKEQGITAKAVRLQEQGGDWDQLGDNDPNHSVYLIIVAPGNVKQVDAAKLRFPFDTFRWRTIAALTNFNHRVVAYRTTNGWDKAIEFPASYFGGGQRSEVYQLLHAAGYTAMEILGQLPVSEWGPIPAQIPATPVRKSDAEVARSLRDKRQAAGIEPLTPEEAELDRQQGEVTNLALWTFGGLLVVRGIWYVRLKPPPGVIPEKLVDIYRTRQQILNDLETVIPGSTEWVGLVNLLQHVNGAINKFPR